MKGVKKAISLFVLLSTVIAETPKKFINIQGDVKIIGLFQIYETDNADCGTKVLKSSVMAAEAVKWYLEGLNSNGLLPFTIGFEGYETCRQNDRAAELAIEVLNRSLSKEGIAGIIGPEFSSEAEVISPILSSVPMEKRLVQVGFSTTAARLSNEDKFPNLIRVIPLDDVQVEVMIQSMIQLEWNRIAIIFEDDTYGQEASSRLRLRAEQENICVSVVKKLIKWISAAELATILNDIIVGSGRRPSAGGIVYIGSSSTARTVLLSLNGVVFSTVPIVMLSEGANMDTSIFRKSNGDVLSKTKGFLVLSPTYREITEFTLHWKSIFTNTTYFEKEFATNPWLMDIYLDINPCEDRMCKFTELTESKFHEEFDVQPLYIQYSTVAAHTLVKGIKMLHDELCVPPGSCTSFETEFRAGDVLDKLKGIHINMAIDFPWSLQSLSTPQLDTEISPDGELVLPENKPSYQLFNFRRTSASDFSLVKIGDYVNTDLTIDTDNIRDYNSTGAELDWPYVRKGQCNIRTKCEECIPIQYLHESFIHEPGDVYVIAAVAVFDKLDLDACKSIRKVSGYQVVESIRFAIEKVNTKTGDFANMFLGIKVGLVVLNSCNSQVVIQRKLYDLHKNGITLQDGTVVTLKNKIIGVVGDVGSDISISIAEVLTKLKLVQISFASTSPTLSDRTAYPFFLRNVSPDDAQAKAIVGVIRKLNADYVQIVYSAGEYGERGRDQIREAAYMNEICIAQEISVEETGSGYEIYEKLRTFAHARLVIIFIQSHRLEEIMSDLVTKIKNKGEFMFIGSEAWARKIDPLINDKQQRLLGSFTLALEMYQDGELRDHMRKLEPKPYNQNPWSLTYLQIKRNCYFNISFDKTINKKCTFANDLNNEVFELDSWDTSAYIATKCLLDGANSHLKDVCRTAPLGLCENYASDILGLVQEIKTVKLDLDQSGNKIHVFNANGDGNIGYRIYNIQRDETLQNLIYVEVGRYPLEGTFTFEKHLTVTPTGAELVSKCPNSLACSGCFKQKDKNTTEAEKSIDIGTLVLGVLLALAAIIVVILAVIIARQCKKPHNVNQDYIHPTAVDRRQEDFGSEELPEIHNL